MNGERNCKYEIYCLLLWFYFYLTKDMNNFPKALHILAFGKLWDTFSYYGTQTILVLYLIHTYHLTETTSYLIYGAYAAFMYTSPTLGGIIADRWIGSRNALLFGSALNLIGNLLLASLSHYWFCVGLAMSLMGSGLYKSNSAHMVGTLYELMDVRKESGFTWFYLANNVGGVLGPLVYGIVVYLLGWHFCFLFSAAGILFSSLWLLYGLFSSRVFINEASAKHSLAIYPLIIIACFLLSFPFYWPASITPIICILFAGSFAYLLTVIQQYTGVEKRHLYALLLLNLFSLFYYAASWQIGSTVTLFIQSKIEQGAIHTHLPASTFSLLYPLFVLILAPLFSKIWGSLSAKGFKQIDAAIKSLIGLVFGVLGTATFAVAVHASDILFFIILGNVFLGAGELALVPASYTATSNLAPPGLKSTMMGGRLLFTALGGYLSVLLARSAEFTTSLMNGQTDDYQIMFWFIAGFTGLMAVLSTCLIPKLKRMML